MKPHPPSPAVSSANLREVSRRAPRWQVIALLDLTASVERYQVPRPHGVAGILAVQREGTPPGAVGPETACETGPAPFR